MENNENQESGIRVQRSGELEIGKERRKRDEGGKHEA